MSGVRFKVIYGGEYENMHVVKISTSRYLLKPNEVHMDVQLIFS